MVATYEDASLIVQIMQWSAMVGLDDALMTIFDKDFDPEKATMSNPHVRKVLTFGETVGTFVKQGVLDSDIVNDLWALQLSWRKVRRAALLAREEAEEPRLFENFEALVREAPVATR